MSPAKVLATKLAVEQIPSSTLNSSNMISQNQVNASGSDPNSRLDGRKLTITIKLLADEYGSKDAAFMDRIQMIEGELREGGFLE